MLPDKALRILILGHRLAIIMAEQNQCGLPVAYYRGGTSKALFFHENVLPSPGTERDKVLKRVMGSPDPLQIDGMGGAKAVTSKIAIIKKSTRDDADIDYTFVQVGIKEDTISYEGNCGNISAAVGPFAIDEGLVSHRPGISINTTLQSQEVRIYNTGTKKVIVSHVPIDDNGAFVHSGNEKISGVPGTGSPILMDYRHVSSFIRFWPYTAQPNLHKIRLLGPLCQKGCFPRVIQPI